MHDEIIIQKNKMKIIVARYTENMEWTKQFNNVLIYNKGVTLTGGNYDEIMMKLC
jgi:hypothetical protein